MMNDRIKLAEAMGWTPQANEPNGEPVWLSPDGEDPYYLFELPDPFTDANDDYAVLVFMHDKYAGEPLVVCGNGIEDYEAIWEDFTDEVNAHNSTDYGIGDYARAALKVIDAAVDKGDT